MTLCLQQNYHEHYSGSEVIWIFSTVLGNIQYLYLHLNCQTDHLYWLQLWILASDLYPSTFQQAFAAWSEVVKYFCIFAKWIILNGGPLTDLFPFLSAFDVLKVFNTMDNTWKSRWREWKTLNGIGIYFLKLWMTQWKGCATFNSLIIFTAGHFLRKCWLFHICRQEIEHYC